MNGRTGTGCLAGDGGRVGRTKAKILDAANRLLREQGLRKVEMAEVAATVGISRTTLYRHFPSREALFEAIYRDGVAKDRDELREVLARHPDPRRRLQLFAGTTENWMQQNNFLRIYQNDEAMIDSLHRWVIPGSVEMVLEALAPVIDAAEAVAGHAIDRNAFGHVVVRFLLALILFPTGDVDRRPATLIADFVRGLLIRPTLLT